MRQEPELENNRLHKKYVLDRSVYRNSDSKGLMLYIGIQNENGYTCTNISKPQKP